MAISVEGRGPCPPYKKQSRYKFHNDSSSSETRNGAGGNPGVHFADDLPGLLQVAAHAAVPRWRNCSSVLASHFSMAGFWLVVMFMRNQVLGVCRGENSAPGASK